jgi:dTDP-4-dehydrorhamnose reductase
MSRVLVLGGDGMLGHQLLQSLRGQHEVRVTLRAPLATYAECKLFDADNAFDQVPIERGERLAQVIAAYQPAEIINAVGVVKQRQEAKDPIESLEINSLFPHRLTRLARANGARVIHFSTDCVFSGSRGAYTEADAPDAQDLYGRSKLLGELQGEGCLTLRTSIIGRELRRHLSLVEWFLAQRGSVRGFRRAIYSGFTTLEMARIVERLIAQHPRASGLWHVASEPISKYDLLLLLKRYYGLSTEVVPDDAFLCDRSLDAARFCAEFGYRPPGWSQMIAELAEQVRP